MSDHLTLHASALAVGGRGVLLLGVPGSGKSDLALRLIDAPGLGVAGTLMAAELVADDQVELTRIGDELIAAAPAALNGLFEIRGHGILRIPVRASVPLALAVALHPGDPPARLPDPGLGWTALGRTLPLLTLDPTLASAPARIRAALTIPPGTMAEAQP